MNGAVRGALSDAVAGEVRVAVDGVVYDAVWGEVLHDVFR